MRFALNQLKEEQKTYILLQYIITKSFWLCDYFGQGDKAVLISPFLQFLFTTILTIKLKFELMAETTSV